MKDDKNSSQYSRPQPIILQVFNELEDPRKKSIAEDHLRYRNRIGTQNLATIRKLAHAAVAKENTLKCGKAGKRVAAATDPGYREKLIKIFF